MWMQHPDLPDSPPAEVAESAFRDLWGPRGWIEADPPPDDLPEATKPAGDGGLSHATTGPEPTPARKRSKETT